MKFVIYGEEYECERYEKDADELRLYDESGTCTAAFGGISDWDGYSLDGEPLRAEIVSEGGQT